MTAVKVSIPWNEKLKGVALVRIPRGGIKKNEWVRTSDSSDAAQAVVIERDTTIIYVKKEGWGEYCLTVLVIGDDQSSRRRRCV